MAANTKKQNTKEKKNNATKKNNKEKPTSKENKPKEGEKPELPKKVKPKLLPMPKTKLKPKYRKKCGKDVACIYDEDSFRPTIDDIYHNLNSFGFMIDVPNETPHTKKSFKVKCKGIKNPKIYKEPTLDKKKFGFFLPKMNSSLYVAKQQDYNCYNPKKEIKRENLPLGKLCYKDLECESKNCSNIKFLGLPGKCILPKNTNKVTENGKCNYDKDCKKNLTCIDRKCVRKPKSVLNTIAMKKAKKQSQRNKTKGIVSSYTPSFIKNRLPSGVFSSSNGTNQNLVNLSNSNISELKENENFYFDDKGEISQIDCQNDRYCRSIDKDSVCYKNKCVSINKRCNLDDINSCLSGTNTDEEKNCCDIKSRCVKIKDTNDGICVNLDKLPKGNIGESCFENKNCKSNKCSSVNKCIPSSGYGNEFNVSFPCDTSIHCVRHELGTNELVCKNNICQKLDEIKINSQEIFDECLESNQCKSKNCGLWDDNGPRPTYMLLKDKKICLGKPKEVRKRLKQLQKKKEKINKDFSRTFNKNIDLLKKKLDSELLFIHAGVYNNSLVIIKKNNKLFLGKILETIHFNKKNEKKEISTTIIYFDETENSINLSEDYENLKVICSDTYSVYYDYFSDVNYKNLSIQKIKSNSVNLQNKFIFEYLCFILFGRRQTLFVPGFFGYYDATVKYCVFQDSIISLDEVKKENILGIKYDKVGLYQTLSIPFIKKKK